MSSLAHITAWIITYKYFILFPISIIEGPIITIIGGFLSSLGYLNIFIVYLLVVVGDMIGDSLFYLLGHMGGKHMITRYGHHIGITEDMIRHVELVFNRHMKKTLVFGKLTQGFGMFILIIAGVIRAPFKNYLATNFFATLFKSLVLVLVGYYFGSAYEVINTYLKDAVWAFVILSVLFVLLWYITIRLTKHFFNTVEEKK